MSKINPILYFAVKYNGNFDKIFYAIRDKEKLDFEVLEELEKKYEGKYITLLDENYPCELRKALSPPFILFYKGNIDLLSHLKKIAVVGTRNPSSYGLKVTKELSKGLADLGYCIVSGLAKGVDATAHRSALESSSPTIAVVAHGLDIIYPQSNSQLYNDIVDCGGLIISEYPDGVEPTKDKFVSRNRIVAFISKGVLITEAFERSGTLTTVKYALYEGREVFAVPDKINNGSICNTFIKEGAKLVEKVEDIDEEFYKNF